MGSNKSDPVHSNPCVLLVLTVLLFKLQLPFVIHKSSSPGEMDKSNRVIRMSPGNRNVPLEETVIDHGDVTSVITLQ